METVKLTLETAPHEEKELFYSSQKPEHDQEIGCLGHLRMDFGRRGNEFWTTWEDHCAELKTTAFKEEFNDVINVLREGVLKDRAAMSSYCLGHPQAKIAGESGDNYGFKVKTDNYIYYLRCNASPGMYNLYCYAYERGKLEKCLPPVKLTLADKLEAGKQKAARQGKSNTPKTRETGVLE